MDNATQLHAFGIEPTTNRIQILSLFLDAHFPLSASVLIRMTREKKIHRATIFRTISLFEERKLVKRIDFMEGEFRYELTTLPHHHHLICRACGDIQTMEECPVTNVVKRVKRKTGFQTIDHSCELFGVCKKCSVLV